MFCSAHLLAGRLVVQTCCSHFEPAASVNAVSVATFCAQALSSAGVDPRVLSLNSFVCSGPKIEICLGPEPISALLAEFSAEKGLGCISVLSSAENTSLPRSGRPALLVGRAEALLERFTRYGP